MVENVKKIDYSTTDPRNIWIQGIPGVVNRSATESGNRRSRFTQCLSTRAPMGSIMLRGEPSLGLWDVEANQRER